MKRLIQKTLVLMAVMLIGSTASKAHDFEVGGIYYNITSETDLTVEVTYRGGGPYVYENEYSVSVVIPETVTYNGKTYSVTSIGEWAFSYCSSLISITIPNSVTSIGEWAFSYCSSLISITIPNSVTSIGKRAFYECFDLIRITIGNSVTSIGSSAFSGCSSLASAKVEKDNSVYESCDDNHCILIRKTGTIILCIRKTPKIECISTTQTTITLKVTPLESDGLEEYGIRFNEQFLCQKDGLIVLTDLVPGRSYPIIPYTVNNGIKHIYEQKIEYINVADYYETETKAVDVSCKLNFTPTTLTFIGSHGELGDAIVEGYGFEFCHHSEGFMGKDYKWIYYCPNVDRKSFNVGEPETLWKYPEGPYYYTINEYRFYIIVNKEKIYSNEWNGKYNYPSFFKTPSPSFTTLPAKATSNTKAVICAETNIANEETGTGFEFRRIDAPDLVPSTIVYCAVHDGVMEGILNNLSANTYYKYRPFYKSASGKMYYGEWIGFGTADAYVYFTPTVHTYATAGVESNSVTLNGYALPGSDDILEQGFEYWTDGFVGTRAAGEVITVAATGQRMSITLNDLQYNTTYRYRAYVKTAKETTYGEEMSFTTGADPAGIGDVAAEDLDIKVRTVQGDIELCLTGEPATVRYALYTLNGTSIANGQLTSGEEWQRVGDSSLPQGLYLLRVENNKLCRTVKVMVKQ